MISQSSWLSDGTTSTTITATRRSHDVLRGIRKHPVSFGNPALGTYRGNVYTVVQHGDDDDNVSDGMTTLGPFRSNNRSNGVCVPSVLEEEDEDEGEEQREGRDVESQHLVDIHRRPADRDSVIAEGATKVRRLAAMVDVPPEQVPEGILNLARSHRPWIDHVRILIAEDNAYQDEEDDDDDDEDGDGSSDEGETEEEKEDRLVQKEDATNFGRVGSTSHNHVSGGGGGLHYLVLFEVCSEEAAQQLVEELHQKPYTILDETEVCSVYHVVALECNDGVSLLSPFFAASAATTITTGASSMQHSMISEHTTTSTEGGSEETKAETAANGSTQHSDDYICAVCLEHMSPEEANTNSNSSTGGGGAGGGERTAILTTVCNHSFHMDCLLRWQDSPCPVCRYDHSGLNNETSLSQCHVCGTTDNNYVCLICGVISCGGGGDHDDDDDPRRQAGDHEDRHGRRYPQRDGAATACGTDDDDDHGGGSGSAERYGHHRAGPNYDDEVEDHRRQHHHRRLMSASSHAKRHYDETLHAYALDTETQHVWDFVGHGYVHRLLQNKDDGKLVEVNDPNNTTSHERTTRPGLSDAQSGELVHRKLEGYASQYHTLLKSQLEQQRTYYEGKLEEIRREHDNHDDDNSNSNTYSGKKISKKISKKKNKDSPRKMSSGDLISALKNERQQLSHRLMTLRRRSEKVRDDVVFLKNMNESLEANREPLRMEVARARSEREETRAMLRDCLPALQEKVMSLMLQLECDDDDHRGRQQPNAMTGNPSIAHHHVQQDHVEEQTASSRTRPSTAKKPPAPSSFTSSNRQK